MRSLLYLSVYLSQYSKYFGMTLPPIYISLDVDKHDLLQTVLKGACEESWV